MPDLVELRVARDQEHVTSYSILKHLLASDPIIAEGKEDPRHIGLDVLLVNYSKRVK